MLADIHNVEHGLGFRFHLLAGNAEDVCDAAVGDAQRDWIRQLKIRVSSLGWRQRRDSGTDVFDVLHGMQAQFDVSRLEIAATQLWGLGRRVGR